MGFGEATRSGFRNYVTFSGRAARSEFWYWTLFVVLSSIVASVLDGALGLSREGYGPLNGLWNLATLLPSIAVAVRRLHDRDMSGWWYLLVLLPLIGWLVLLFLFVQKGSDGANRFGPDPLGPGGPDDWTRAPSDDPAMRTSSVPRVGRHD